MNQDPQGPQVAADVRGSAAENFGGHPRQRSSNHASRVVRVHRPGHLIDHVARQPVSQAEVEHLEAALGIAEDVGALEIAMDDAAAVRMCKRVGRFDRTANDGGRVVSARRDTSREASALDVFHRDVGVAVLLADIVDGADVGMIQSGGGASLPHQSRPATRFVVRFVEELEGDVPVQANVARPVDHAHAAGPESSDDLIRTNARAGSQGHSWEGISKRPYGRLFARNASTHIMCTTVH